jgi:Major Facilitator Superfamily
MVVASLLVTSASLLLPLFPSFWPVALSQGIAHAARVIFPPAIAAVSLGVAGHRNFTARIGRNESFNHAGIAAAASFAGATAYIFGPQTVFYVLAFNSIASLASVLAIPEKAIDHHLARGLHAAEDKPNAAGGAPVKWLNRVLDSRWFFVVWCCWLGALVECDPAPQIWMTLRRRSLAHDHGEGCVLRPKSYQFRREIARIAGQTARSAEGIFPASPSLHDGFSLDLSPPRMTRSFASACRMPGLRNSPARCRGGCSAHSSCSRSREGLGVGVVGSSPHSAGG